MKDYSALDTLCLHVSFFGRTIFPIPYKCSALFQQPSSYKAVLFTLSQCNYFFSPPQCKKASCRSLTSAKTIASKHLFFLSLSLTMGKCLMSNMIYKATVNVKINNQKEEEKIYIGSMENNWKKGWYNHKMSLSNKKYEMLSSYV